MFMSCKAWKKHVIYRKISSCMTLSVPVRAELVSSKMFIWLLLVDKQTIGHIKWEYYETVVCFLLFRFFWIHEYSELSGWRQKKQSKIVHF